MKYYIPNIKLTADQENYLTLTRPGKYFLLH